MTPVSAALSPGRWPVAGQKNTLAHHHRRRTEECDSSGATRDCAAPRLYCGPCISDEDRFALLLSLSNISLRRGRKMLVENVSLQVHAGERMGLIGANGSGKSSLFAMILGELEADDGELGLHPSLEIAHVAQQSPHGAASAVDHVMDGDRELRTIAASIARAEKTGESAKLPALYERMEGG